MAGRGELTETGVDRAHDPAGIPLVEARGDNLRHGVVLGLVVAGDKGDGAMAAALERIAWLGREDLDAAPIQGLFHVVGEGTYQPSVLPGGVEPTGFLSQLAVEPDQVGRHGREDEPSGSLPEPLVLLVQPVDDRFPVRSPSVELGEVLLYLGEVTGQIAGVLVLLGQGKSPPSSLGAPGCV